MKELPKELPAPYPGEEIMWVTDVRRSRKRGLKAKRCTVMWASPVAPEGQQKFFWWESTWGTGSGVSRESTPVMIVSDVLSAAGTEDILYIIMDEEAYKKAAPKRRRCVIATFVPQLTLSMLRSAPNNETFRAMLMADLLEMPPKEADTYEKIVDWVEYNFPREIPVATLAESTRPPDLQVIGITYTERERGRCYYDRINKWRGSIGIDPETLLRIATEARNDGAFRDMLHMEIQRICSNMEGEQGPEECYDHDTSSYDEKRTLYHADTVATAYSALRRYAPQEVLSKFRLRAEAGNPTIGQVARPILPVVNRRIDDEDEEDNTGDEEA
jgi:hypothetical protein